MCKLGGSGGPQQLCDEVGCAPPVDTKFEATFGDNGLQCNPIQQERMAGIGGGKVI